MLDERLERGLMDGRQPAQPCAKGGKIVADMGFCPVSWLRRCSKTTSEPTATFGILDSLRVRQIENWLWQLAQIY